MSVRADRHEAAILVKDSMTAVLKLSVVPHGSFLGRTSPVDTPPIAVSACQSPEVAEAKFESALKTSEENGWRVAWRGVPNEG